MMGDQIQFTANGVSDPNSAPDGVRLVIWYWNPMAFPDFRRNFPGATEALVLMQTF